MHADQRRDHRGHQGDYPPDHRAPSPKVRARSGFTTALLLFVADRTRLWELFVVMGLAGLGIGCSFAVMPRMIMSAVPPSQTGSALALNQVLRQVGFSVGSALSATILTAHTVTSSPYPSSHGSTVGAWVAIGMCVSTAALSIAAQLRQGNGVRGSSDVLDDLAEGQSADSAMAGVVAYEPDGRDAAAGPDPAEDGPSRRSLPHHRRSRRG